MYSEFCTNLDGNCEIGEKCSCGEIMENIKQAEKIVESGNKRTIGELIDNPSLGSAIMATRVYLKRYVHEIIK